MRKYTLEDVEFIKGNFAAIGPKIISEKLGRTVAAIGHKGIRLGLSRGIARSNYERRNKWKF